MLDNGSPTLPKQLIFHVLVSFKVPQYTGLDLSMQSVDLLRIFPLFVYISMVIGSGGVFEMRPLLNEFVYDLTENSFGENLFHIYHN